MAHQSLYRRYRPRTFREVRGQDHVVGALRNAVAGGSEGHAYLFSGPRGTGKTSTARILAKALNCPNLKDGEPCGECESCLAIEHGTSYDLFELDAASNNGVDAMRDLISRTVVGSPGRTKVYILDEVHMLSAAASNTLLKTLEEPPEHVCFVLATTDPQKVLPTIRSRTQHFEFSLLSATELTDYVRWIIGDAGLTVDDSSVEYVVRQGRGSARDTLSALDMAVAAGGVTARPESIEEILAAVIEKDTGRVMTAVADAVAQGREPRLLAEQLIVTLRDAFLTSVRAHLDHLSDQDQARLAALASSLGTATITRSLELIGSAAVDMRQAPDPRVPLEVALIRLTAPTTDASPAALLERIEDLERRVAHGAPQAPAAAPSRTPPPPAPSRPQRAAAPASPAAPAAKSPAPPAPSRPAPKAAPAPVPEPAATPAPVAKPAPAPAGELLPLEALAAAMTEAVIPTLSGMTKSLFSGGHFTGHAANGYRFALDNVPDRLLDRAETARATVEAALAARLGQAVTLILSNGASNASKDAAPPAASAPKAKKSQAAPEPTHEEDHIDISDLEDAKGVSTSGVDKLVQAFPGAQLVDEES